MRAVIWLFPNVLKANFDLCNESDVDVVSMQFSHLNIVCLFTGKILLAYDLDHFCTCLDEWVSC